MSSINSDKRKEYTKRKRENEHRMREERRIEKIEGRTTHRRLAFFVNIFKSLGYTQEALAHRCGLSPQLMSWYFSVADDCRISRLEQMFGGLGLSLKIHLDGPIDSHTCLEGFSEGVRFRTEGSLGQLCAPSILPNYITNCSPENRLYFLKKFLESRKMKLIDFANKCDLNSDCVKYYFIKDDMKVSVLYKIALLSDAEIVWIITSKAENSDSPAVI